MRKKCMLTQHFYTTHLKKGCMPLAYNLLHFKYKSAHPNFEYLS